MKTLKFVNFFFLVIFILACSAQKNSTKKNVQNEKYINYLSSVINDTTFYEIPEIIITDNRIYNVLDSIILWSEKCRYFDSKVKYLNTFRFAALPKENDLLYFIHAHMSPYTAFNLLLVETGELNEIEKRIGAFYYKHYLFVVPTEDYRGQKKLEYFPFFKLSGNKLKLAAPKFFHNREYFSFITFDILHNNFRVKSNEICGLQVLIK